MGNLKSRMKRSRSKEKKRSKKEVNLPSSASAKKTVDPRLPFTNYRQIFSIRNAWKAVSRAMEDTAKENLIRFFKAYPHYQEVFTEVKDMKDEDEMRASETFEMTALEIFEMFDEVIENLETVDVAIDVIHRTGQTTVMTKQMMQDMQSTFIETLSHTLGSDRFTEATTDNYRLLYEFVRTEMEESQQS